MAELEPSSVEGERREKQKDDTHASVITCLPIYRHYLCSVTHTHTHNMYTYSTIENGQRPQVRHRQTDRGSGTTLITQKHTHVLRTPSQHRTPAPPAAASALAAAPPGDSTSARGRCGGDHMEITGRSRGDHLSSSSRGGAPPPPPPPPRQAMTAQHAHT